MHLRLITCCAAVVASFLPVVASAATTQQVQQAVDKAKAYLYAQQLKDHTWEYAFDGHGVQKSGQTALAVYALLAAGESAQDPRLAPAIEYLRKTSTTGVYALGLRCQIWLMLPPTQEVKAAMNRDANILVRGLKRGAGQASGFYDYNAGGSGTAYSHSRAQYGVLGVWAAEQMGLQVPREYWFVVEKAWLEHQDPSGGWNYIWRRDDFPVTPGMTAVGIATLFITQDYLRAQEGLNCGGNIRNEAIDRGMKWLSDNFDKVATDEIYHRDLPYSTLYSVERVGVASGFKYFNGIDWYQKGADWLVKKQKSDGSFPSEFTGIKHYTTGLAVLFLIRGSSPLMMNKLDYSAAGAGPPSAEGAERPRGAATVDDKEAHWNQRPRDVANLARWTGRQIERELNWQIVNLDGPVDDFHDAPILYIAGNQRIELSDEQAAKIKAFVEQGGIVLGHADCSSENFSNGFKAMASKMFAYEFTPLPENHVIYTNQQFPRSKWKGKPNVLSMSNGARELMLLLPDADMARGWQMQQHTGPREEHFQLGTNLFLYAVDKKNLRRRGESFLVKKDEKITPSRALKVARIVYSGNWDPEPGGWRRLAAVMNNERDVALTVQPVKAGAGELAKFKVAHLTGTMPFKLEDAQRAEIANFVKGGGLLIVDAAGGSTAFTTAAEAELAAMFPGATEQLKQTIAPTHAILLNDGKPLEVDYRTFARSKLGNVRGPQLRGLSLDGRLAVIYSREDLSVGLVGQPVDGIVGYDPASATRLMANILDKTLPPSSKPLAKKSATTKKAATTRSAAGKK
jgi:hypothetical protein